MSSLPDVSLGEAAEFHRVPAPRDVHAEPPVQVPQASRSGTVLDLPDAETGAVDLPDADLGGTRMTGLERVWILISHWVRQTAQTVQQTAARPGGIGHAQPESWVQYRARVKARTWLPDGYSGGWLEWIPVAFHHTVGPFGFGVGHGIAWLLTHMFCFTVAVLLIAVVVLGLCFS